MVLKIAFGGDEDSDEADKEDQEQKARYRENNRRFALCLTSECARSRKPSHGLVGINVIRHGFKFAGQFDTSVF